MDEGDDPLRERVAALKHDLGKYVAWASANLAETAWTGPVGPELLDALRRDLLQTRSHDGRHEAAWDVWDRLTADLPRPLEVAELAACEGAVAQLRAAAPALRAADADAVARLRDDVREAQQRIREQLGRLQRRLSEDQACRRS